MKLLAALTATVAGACVLLGAPGPASAAPPVLAAAGHSTGHPTATWTLPGGVLSRTIEFATQPTVGSDGSFFDENVKLFDTLEDTQTTYLASRRLDPGTYFVHVAGVDWPCFVGGGCAIREYSNVLTVTIPNTVPTIKVQSIRAYKYIHSGSLTATICDAEGGGTAAVTTTVRRYVGARVVATATSTDTVYLLAGCDSELVQSPCRRGSTGKARR